METTKDMNYLHKIIKDASNVDLRTHLLSEKALKLNEEVGELSAEVLKLSGYKNSDLSKEEIRARIIEEAVDSIVMIVDILNTVHATDQEMTKCGEDAVAKWMDKHIKKNG